MQILLSNGTCNEPAPVLAYSRTDLRVPALIARRVRAVLGDITSAWLDRKPVRVEERPDGALAVITG